MRERGNPSRKALCAATAIRQTSAKAKPDISGKSSFNGSFPVRGDFRQTFGEVHKMNTALLTPYYGDDMPIVFFDEVVQGL